MNIRKADDFIADAELQYQWYAEHAGWDVAERYLAAIAGTCALIERHPVIGPAAAFTPAARGLAVFRRPAALSPTRLVL